ncbi:D-3-phosphoglycerate dehydrogenase [Arthrobacter sp. Hiyo6]|nr:D-3-phosphoglycerate dehydrogenase [Arthrobacter sp. Hiyo6]
MSDVIVGSSGYARLCPAGRSFLLDAGLTLNENPYERPLLKSELLDAVVTARAGIVGVEVWDADVFAAAPNLKVLTKLGSGVDNIDLSAAAAHGVTVCNAPGGNANAVAEITVGLVLAGFRQIPRLDANLRAGGWDRYVGPELTGKTVGLIGFGAIGALVAHRLLGFDCAMLAYDPYPNAALAAERGVELVDLDELLARADVLSLHLPSLPSTHHFVNHDFLAKAKRGAFLVNTARGTLVDEAALTEAIQSGQLGASLDVFENEPISSHSPLLDLENVVLTSHAAADSIEAYRNIGQINAHAILDVLGGREPANVVTS